MPGRDINKEILINTIKSDYSNGTTKSVEILKRNYPELSQQKCESIIELINEAITSNEADKVSIVVTAPPSFAINARTTMSVVQSMISGAERNIIITGYSLSSYFSDLVDIIIDKSHIDKQQGFDKLLRYKGRFLNMYNYKQSDDKMSALHAKVLSVDGYSTLITSANLSYHGQQGNIELGTKIDSKTVAKQIDDIFTKLIFSKVFVQL